QIEGLQLGTIEGFIGPADFYVGVDKRYGVFSASILFRDRNNAAAALADPDLNKAILALGTDKDSSESGPSPMPRTTISPRIRPAPSPISRARRSASTPPRSSARRWRGSARLPRRCRSTRCFLPCSAM